MTVINALKFDDESGGMVADEESSNFHNLRKYDLTEKVLRLGDGKSPVIFLGGSGNSSLLKESRDRIKADYTPEKSVLEVTKSLSDIMQDIKRQKIDGYLKSTYGVNSAEALAGSKSAGDKMIQINPSLLEQINRDYKAHTEESAKFFENVFLVIGRDKDGVSLYQTSMSGAPFSAYNRYLTLGSGSDESDKVLYRFLKGFKREQRGKIDFVEGMAALIRATNASIDFNIGVGGVPAIAYFNSKNAKTLKEDESRMAVELVRVGDAGLISGDKMREGLNSLLVEEKSHKEVEEGIFGQSKKYRQIMSFLRGYRD